jgi:ADP-ribose pyrophosphatase YjhB (NUDIX family)
MTRIDHHPKPAAPLTKRRVVVVSVFVLNDDGQILTTRRRDSDLYSIPGGIPKIGETSPATAVRVTREITGIYVEVTDLSGVYSDPDDVIEFPDGEIRQEFSVCFRARPVGGELRSCDGNSEVRWTERSMLDETAVHPSVMVRIRHGLDDRGEPHYC